MLEYSDPLLNQYLRNLLGDPQKDRKVYEQDSPIKYIQNIRAPLLVLQGDNDPRVPNEETKQLVEILKKGGNVVDVVYYPDEGHGFASWQFANCVAIAECPLWHSGKELNVYSAWGERAKDLPDLGDDADVIVADNIRATQALYASAMLEEVKLFSAVDRLVELFAGGQLPLGRGNAGKRLYQYWKSASSRLSERDRRNLYSRTFGFPGGDAVAAPNQEFADLWLRFVAAVAEFRNLPERKADVWEAGLELARNLSKHGHGTVPYAASELQAQLREVMAILSDAEIRTMYSARDAWEVVERVAVMELGGAKSAVRYRTKATAGTTIIGWLAKHCKQLKVLRRNVAPRPVDHFLIEACDAWLAAAAEDGTSDRSAVGGG